VAEGFTLSKWYLDCVGGDGDALVAYAAEMRWGPLTLRYASTLRRRPGELEATAATTMREVPWPVESALDVTWSAPLLGLEGRWTGLGGPIEATVLESTEGSVRWRCIHPRARAAVTHAGERIEGLGYVEVLTLTMAPWRLPIDELRWGRFLGERHALVWIDWRGPHSRRVAWLDGAQVDLARVDTDLVASERGQVRLSIDPGGLLRRGALGRTALAVVPAVDRLLPVRILATDETKWCARGVLDADGDMDTGWVVHEVVSWPAR
jgi:hypothetical protein